MKKCYGCNKLKPKSEFAKNSGRKDGLQSQCRNCMKKRRQTKEYRQKHREYVRKNREENPEAQLIRNMRRSARRIGLKPETVIAHYFKRLDEQNSCCEICGRHVSSLNRRLDLDHNHNTLQLRGLLCTNCNQRIGLCWEDISILKKTIRYLEKYNNLN